MEKIKKILQVFSTRSGNALTKVRINRLLKTPEELQGIFSSIKSSISSIKILMIRQSIRLNSLTRAFARSIPQLQVLFSSQQNVLNYRIESFVDKHSNLWFYSTTLLEDLQEEDIKWLSHLRHLEFGAAVSRSELCDVLKACGPNLEHLGVGVIGPDDDQLETDPIMLNALLTLQFQDWLLVGPVSHLCFKTPALTSLSCRLSRIQTVESSSSLALMKLMLGDEGEDQWLDEGEILWEEPQEDEFIGSLKSAFCQIASTKVLVIEGISSNFQVQLQSILQALSVCSETNSKEVLLPNLISLCIKGLDESYDFEQLARVAIKRKKFNYRTGIIQKYGPKTISDVETELEKSITDPEERLQLLIEQIDLQNQPSDFRKQMIIDLKEQLMGALFRVRIDPAGSSLKSQMTKKYQETKKRMRGVELEQ